MLLLTKLDKTRVLVTLETIKYIEETPDTLIRFLNGESVIVRESLDEVSRLADEMRRRVNAAASVRPVASPVTASQASQSLYNQ